MHKRAKMSGTSNSEKNDNARKGSNNEDDYHFQNILKLIPLQEQHQQYPYAIFGKRKKINIIQKRK